MKNRKFLDDFAFVLGKNADKNSHENENFERKNSHTHADHETQNHGDHAECGHGHDKNLHGDHEIKNHTHDKNHEAHAHAENLHTHKTDKISSKNRKFLDNFAFVLGKNGENFNAKQSEHANGECENLHAHGECGHGYDKNLHADREIKNHTHDKNHEAHAHTKNLHTHKADKISSKNRKFLNDFALALGKNGENFNAKQSEHANGECENLHAHGECGHNHDNNETQNHAECGHGHDKNLHADHEIKNHTHDKNHEAHDQTERENENFKGLNCKNHAKNSHSHEHKQHGDHETHSHDKNEKCEISGINLHDKGENSHTHDHANDHEIKNHTHDKNHEAHARAENLHTHKADKISSKNRKFLDDFAFVLGKNGENFNAKQSEHANGECENLHTHDQANDHETQNHGDHAECGHGHDKNLHGDHEIKNHTHDKNHEAHDQTERENENFNGLSCKNHAKNSHRHEHKQHAECGHSHAHTSNKRVLKISFFIIFLFMVIEVIGGFITNSLALLSDATHMLSDALALALALLAFKIGEKNGTLRHTFGYKRVEILVAFLNSITLLAIAVWIVFEAISRFKNPLEIATFGMLLVSFVGLLVNLIVAFYMLKKADVSENVNLKGAYLHVLSDLLGSAGAVVAGLLMIFFNLFIADAIVSVLVAILVAKSGWGLLKATFHILMEGSPVNVNSDEILTAILGVNGVKSIHDLHIWSISSGINALCAHVVVDSTLSIKEGQDIINSIENALKKLNITHQTIQLETAKNGCDDRLICNLKGDNNGHLGHNH